MFESPKLLGLIKRGARAPLAVIVRQLALRQSERARALVPIAGRQQRGAGDCTVTRAKHYQLLGRSRIVEVLLTLFVSLFVLQQTNSNRLVQTLQ